MAEIQTRYQDVSRHGFTVVQLGQVEIARLNAIIDIIPNNIGSILDVGCGEGLITNPLVAKNYQVVGCDISHPSLEFVQSSKTQASIESLPFDDQTFDLVLSSSVLEHLPNEFLNKCIHELERVSRKYILVSTPYKEDLWKLLTKCPHCASVYHKNLHLHSFDENSLENLFPKFTPVDISYGKDLDWKPGWIIWVAQHIFNRYSFSRSEIKCPVCGIKFSKTNKNPTLTNDLIHNGKNKRRKFENLVKGLNWIFKKLSLFTPKKPSHIVILLKKQS